MQVDVHIKSFFIERYEMRNKYWKGSLFNFPNITNSLWWKFKIPILFLVGQKVKFPKQASTFRYTVVACIEYKSRMFSITEKQNRCIVSWILLLIHGRSCHFFVQLTWHAVESPVPDCDTNGNFYPWCMRNLIPCPISVLHTICSYWFYILNWSGPLCVCCCVCLPYN